MRQYLRSIIFDTLTEYFNISRQEKECYDLEPQMKIVSQNVNYMCNSINQLLENKLREFNEIDVEKLFRQEIEKQVRSYFEQNNIDTKPKKIKKKK